MVESSPPFCAQVMEKQRKAALDNRKRASRLQSHIAEAA
jgi:hypothetical protein